MKQESISRKAFLCFNYLFMLFMIVVCLYPMLYVLFASLSDSNLLMAHQGLLTGPLGYNLEAYKAVAKYPIIASGYANTIFVVVVGVVVNLIMTVLAAYFLSRRDVMLKNHVMVFIIITMFFSGGMIPFYLVVNNIGLSNTLWSLIFPVAINTYNMIILRTSFQGVPASLEEAAIIDGAGPVRILTRVILPLSKAALAVMVLYYGVWHWNAWFNAMLFLKDRTKFPLQLILREILIQNDTQAMTQGAGLDVYSIAESVKYTVIIIATLPILCIYPFLQKYFVKGVMVGALKG